MASVSQKAVIIFGIILLLFCKRDCLALDRSMSSALTHYIMASVYDSLDNQDKAVSEYKKALKSDYTNSLIHLDLASVYIKSNSIDKAIEELKLAVKFDPEGVEPHAILALLYSLKDNKDSANKEYEIALQNASRINPKNAEIYKGLGLLYVRQKKFDAAIKAYEMALSIAAQDPQTHYYLSNIYYENNNKLKTEEELKAAINLNPDYSDALNFLGYFYAEENKNLDQAEVMVKKALEFDPENGAYLDSLGWIYFKQGKDQEAIKCLLKAAALVEDPEIYAHLGEVYFKIGDKEKAKINWEKSLKVDPGQKEIETKLKNLL